jgi:hypothetical protein
MEKTMVKITFESNEVWMYLWLKYVKSIDTSVHCGKCLIGEYSKKIDAQKNHFSIELDESDSEYFYLCGVTKPYVWKNNFHLAFKKSEGKSFKYNFNGTFVEIENAEKIDFSMNDIDWNLPFARKKEYCTCRNWQFANWFANHTTSNEEK